MQILIGSGPSAPDYVNYLCDAEALVITRRLNLPSELACKLLMQDMNAIMPAAGQGISVVRATSEKLFTGVIENVSDEYLGWGMEGPVYALQMTAKSSESAAGSASAPGGVEQVMNVSAAEMLQAQMSGVAFRATENGAAGSLSLPAMEVNVGESVAALLARASDQGRLAYRVHDGELVVNEAGAMLHHATWCVSSARGDSGRMLSVAAEGAEEAQAYVTEWIACDGQSALIPLAGSVFGAQRRVLLNETFTGTTKLQISGASAGGGVLLTDPGATCDVRIGTTVEMGGHLLFEVAGLNVQSCGSTALVGFVDGTSMLAHCTAGFQMCGGTEGVQIAGVLGGVLSGAPVTLKPSSSYTLRVRVFVPEAVRRTQVIRGFTGTTGGREIPSWGSVHCELLEEGSSPTTSVLASGRLSSVPASASAVVCSGASLDASVTAVKLVSGPAMEVQFTAAGGTARLLRVGAKADGAEAWLSKGQLKLASKPAAGDLVQVRYREGGRASAQGSSGDETGASLGIRLEAPLMRTTEDCENAIAIMLADAATPAANICGTLEDSMGRMGTSIWAGDAVVVDSGAAIIREVKIKPVSLSADVYSLELRFANDAAEPITLKSVKSDAIVATRGMPGAHYADNLTDVQVASASATAVQVECGELQSGALVEVRSSPEGWGSTAGLVVRSANPSFTLNGDVSNGEWFLKQVDANGNYSREFEVVRTSL